MHLRNGGQDLEPGKRAQKRRTTPAPTAVLWLLDVGLLLLATPRWLVAVAWRLLGISGMLVSNSFSLLAAGWWLLALGYLMLADDCWQMARVCGWCLLSTGCSLLPASSG